MMVTTHLKYLKIYLTIEISDTQMNTNHFRKSEIISLSSIVRVIQTYHTQSDLIIAKEANT